MNICEQTDCLIKCRKGHVEVSILKGKDRSYNIAKRWVDFVFGIHRLGDKQTPVSKSVIARGQGRGWKWDLVSPVRGSYH